MDAVDARGILAVARAANRPIARFFEFSREASWHPRAGRAGVDRLCSA
jgi:hypothetical protein